MHAQSSALYPTCLHFRFVALQGKCVEVVDDLAGKGSWYAARQSCINHGGDLAMAKTLHQSHLLFRLMTLTQKGSCFYVGLQTANMWKTLESYRLDYV